MITSYEDYEEKKRYLRMHRPIMMPREIDQLEAEILEYEQNLYFHGVASD